MKSVKANLINDLISMVKPNIYLFSYFEYKIVNDLNII